MSILNVNQIQPVGSGQTVTISATNISAGSATVTAGTFSGNLSSSGISTFSDTVNVGAGKSIRLYGATSGYSEIIAAAGSASTTFTLPANGGSASQYLQTDGSGALSWQTVSTSNLTRGTAVSASGSAIDFTGLPSGIRRLQVTLDAVSSDNNYHILIQLGTSSGFVTSGYDAQSAIVYSATGSVNSSAGFIIYSTASSATHSGIFTFNNNNGNVWVGSYSGANNQAGTPYIGLCGGGRVTLGAELTQVRITFSTSANFDAGTVNVFYEV